MGIQFRCQHDALVLVAPHEDHERHQVEWNCERRETKGELGAVWMMQAMMSNCQSMEGLLVLLHEKDVAEALLHNAREHRKNHHQGYNSYR